MAEESYQAYTVNVRVSYKLPVEVYTTSQEAAEEIAVIYAEEEVEATWGGKPFGLHTREVEVVPKKGK